MKTPTFFLFSLMALCASAHMQLSKPYPIRSPLNKDAKGPKDYSYTSPLSPSGDNFPCKGYAKDAFQSTADYTAGKQYQMTVAGSATHGGGSCQISLSYDQGQTFKVIHSMLGGCPLKDSYDFSIPPDAPAGQALLAWTWFNKIGNREMYMNCAQVTIHSSDSKKMMNRNHRRHHLAARSLDHRAAATPFKQLPAMFVANVNKEGQCTTVESKEVNFPLPGDSVEGKLSDKGYTCKSSAPFLGDKKQQGEISSPSEGGSSPPSSSQPGSPSHAAGGVPGAFYPSSSMAVNPSSSSNSPLASQSTPAASSSSSPTPGSGGSCSQGSIACSSDGKSWTMCQNGSPGAMRPVAAGTLCKNGALVAA